MLDDNQKKMVKDLADNTVARSQITTSLYERYSVKRGLRNEDGTGVLVGLTEIGEVFSYIMDDNDRIPVEGRLFYRGIAINDLVNGFFHDKRYGFEEVAYLLIFGELPTAAELDQFSKLLTANRQLPLGFTEDMILKAPSPDVMNKLARNVLSLYAFDDNADDISIENVLRQCVELIARFPTMVAYAYMAKRHYFDGDSLFLHPPLPEYNTAQNLLHMIRSDGQFTDLEARILDLSLVLHAEHGGGNNSTFVTHAVSSSGSDTYSVIAAAIGSLKGPQHGGASSKAFAMMEDLKKQVKNWRNEIEITQHLVNLLDKKAFDSRSDLRHRACSLYPVGSPSQAAARLCPSAGF